MDLSIKKRKGKSRGKGNIAPVLEMVFSFLDIIRLGEVADFIFRIVKFNIRSLTPTEKAEAQKVFANSINYKKVHIDERSLIAAIGAFFQGGGGMGVTTFHTINFDQKINAAPGNSDMVWLMHELTHIAQYEHAGSRYLAEAISAQATAGYNYGGGGSLAGKNLKDFNREQQGDIIKDYYRIVLYGISPHAADYSRMQQQLVNGEL